MPQGDIEALRRRLGHHGSFADLQVIDLGQEVVQESEVLTHRTLRLAGGSGGEVDVGKLVAGDGDAEIARGLSLFIRRFDQRLGEHQLRAGARDHLRNALGRKVGLDWQIRAAGLENREHCGQPVEVPLGHHADDRFAGDAARHQGSGELIGAGIELPVGELPVAVHGGDGFRAFPGLDLEQLVGPAVGQRSARSGAHLTTPSPGCRPSGCGVESSRPS